MEMAYIIFTVFLFLLALPVLTSIWLLKIIIDGTPALFAQERAGRGGKPFTMYKFRTMVKDAEGLQVKYRRLNEADGPVFKIRNDPRFTPFGRFLSRTGLDELPQLFNVLKGEMALIGPRPLPVAEAKMLKPWMRAREQVLPGIISPWILNGYHSQTFTSWMKSDIAYARTKSFSGDLVLAIKSVRFLLLIFVREVSGWGNSAI